MTPFSILNSEFNNEWTEIASGQSLAAGRHQSRYASQAYPVDRSSDRQIVVTIEDPLQAGAFTQ
jgi:hypothetical protein